MFQAHLPDADKPPLYVDLPAHQENGQLIIDSKLMDRSNMIKGTGFAGLGACDFLIFLIVGGRKAPNSICQQASPGSFDYAL
jgi:hypothetical protein